MLVFSHPGTIVQRAEQTVGAHIHGFFTAAGANALCRLWTNAADLAIVTTYKFVYRQRSKHYFFGEE